MPYFVDGVGWIVNRTPHPIVLMQDSGETVTIEPDGGPIRLETQETVIRPLLVEVSLGEPSEVPEPRWLPVPWDEYNGGAEPFPTEPGEFTTDSSGLYTFAPVVYCVSMPVAQHFARAGRRDFVAPDTGPSSAIRDSDGKIIGVRRFVRYRP